MTRRAGGKGDPSIRAAVIAKRERLAEAFGPGMLALAADARAGAPLELATDLLGGALAHAGHPLHRRFTLAADRDRSRTWRLDEHDVLTEVGGN